MLRRFLLRTLAIAHKEVFHIVRDPTFLFLAILMPLTLIILFGYAVSFDLKDIPIAIVDHSNSAASRRLVDSLVNTGSFRPHVRLSDPALLENLFRRQIVRAGLVVPEDFSSSLARGEITTCQLLLDGADSNTAGIALGYATGTILDFNQQMISRQLGGHWVPPVEARIRVRFNPALTSANFVIPGLIALILTVMGVILTALTVAREWEQGSMEQLFCTPVNGFPVVVGKLIPYFFIGMLQMMLVLAVGTQLFQVPIYGNLLVLILVSAIYLVAVQAQGLLISVITRSQTLATQIGAVSSLLPVMFLSGFLFPISNMPFFLQAISYLVPGRYFITILRGIMLKGNSLHQLLPQFGAITLFAVLLITISTLRFKRSLD